MLNKSRFKFPTEKYLNLFRRVYRDYTLDKIYLTKVLIGL